MVLCPTTGLASVSVGVYSKKWLITIKLLCVFIIAHLIVAQSEVIEAFSPPCRLGAVQIFGASTCKLLKNEGVTLQ